MKLRKQDLGGTTSSGSIRSRRASAMNILPERDQGIIFQSAGGGTGMNFSSLTPRAKAGVITGSVKFLDHMDRVARILLGRGSKRPANIGEEDLQRIEIPIGYSTLCSCALLGCEGAKDEERFNEYCLKETGAYCKCNYGEER